MNTMRFWVAAGVVVCCLGCDHGPKSSLGFTLPDGDATNGKAVFLQLRCYDCHRIAKVDLPEAEESGFPTVALGGKVLSIETYGKLVTSIINPSHTLASRYAKEVVEVDGGSRMKNYNDVMTVTQLIDVVSFLQSQYELIHVDPTY